MNKELEQAAERIATSLYSKPEDDSDWTDDRIEELKQLILTDPFILELVKDTERLNRAAKNIGNIDLYVHPIKGMMISRPMICVGENLRECLDKIDSSIEQGKKEKA